ncbi:MAG TPA: EamA family transporter [Burkholderiaceae bacterium]|nr:EamA family transporter [Burkholderiaceae bacterium]
MSGMALTWVLVAALIHATWNLLAKKTGGDVRFALVSQVAVALVWAPVGLWFAWREVGAWGWLQWALIVASGAIHAVYFVTLLRGYRLADLSVVYPLARGTGPLLTAMVATVLLGESLGLLGWLGVLGVVLGILLISGGPALWHALRAGRGGQAGDADGHPDAHLRRLRAGVGYGLLTGLCIAAYTVVDGYAVKRAGVSPVSVDYLGNVVRVPLTLLWILALGRREPLPLAGYWRATWKPALLIAAISPVAYVLVLYAATLAPLSHVAPAREVSMLFAALLGGTLLRERDAGLRLLGAASIAAGVIALAGS